MAITGDVFYSLIFGDVDSADYDVFVTGEAVYNAPERAVEFVTVPGRNGDVMLDLGRWNNIQVKYPAGVYADTQAEFSQKVAAFRNALASQIGYQRLSDDYHPDEYRIGVFASAFEVTPVQGGKAGEFEITFNCKPQRYLLSGVNEVAVASGSAITNPTLYDAKPLLAIEGYGTIEFNGYSIKIDSGFYGNVDVLGTEIPNTSYGSNDKQYTVIQGTYNPGDDMTVTATWNWQLSPQPQKSSQSWVGFESISNEANAGTGTTTITGQATDLYGTTEMTATFDSSSNATFTNTFTFNALFKDGVTVATTITTTIAYDATNKTISFQAPDWSQNISGHWRRWKAETLSNQTLIADSTLSYLGSPTYIDCEIGEAYRVDDGRRSSLNGYIALGSELPKLAPGANTVTYDNTVTSFEVTPRWWQL